MPHDADEGKADRPPSRAVSVLRPYFSERELGKGVFALTELQRGLQDRRLAGLFINIYGQGDERRILGALEIPEDDCQLHWLLYDVIQMLEKNAQADCSQLGLVCYALTRCGNCRFRSDRLLLKQQAAPQWLTEECRYASGEKCRELFAKPAAPSQRRAS